MKPRHVAAGYVEGIGTSDSWLAAQRDNVGGYTFDRRVETAYFQFCEQAKKWLDRDPDAVIRVASIGFSRGAEQVPALARMIEERGIQNPVGARIKRDSDGLITEVVYPKSPLQAPGQVIQAAMMIDPVATGLKSEDRRLPGSVVSRFVPQMLHERRDQFKASDHIPAGLSDHNRAFSPQLAGAHSDGGNTYVMNGLGARAFNLGVDWFNSLE